MHITTIQIHNFRRLKDVRIELEPTTSIFVGSNNSGKTSAVQALLAFLGTSQERFSVHDFSADCWGRFDEMGSIEATGAKTLPTIRMDLWFEVEKGDLHRVMKLLPSLDWRTVPIGVRLEFSPKDPSELLTRFREAKTTAEKFKHPGKDNKPGFHPWPETLTDYLKRRLNDEYRIFYYVLDRDEFDPDLREKPGYAPQELGDTTETGGSIMRSLLRVDFLSSATKNDGCRVSRLVESFESVLRTESETTRRGLFSCRGSCKFGGAAQCTPSDRLRTNSKDVERTRIPGVCQSGFGH